MKKSLQRTMTQDFDINQWLSRGDRSDVMDNRMFVVCSQPGEATINYWNGRTRSGSATRLFEEEVL